MKQTFLKVFSLLTFALAVAAAPVPSFADDGGSRSFADDGQPSTLEQAQKILGQTQDFVDDTNSNVSNAKDLLENALSAAKDSGALKDLVDKLDKIGLDDKLEKIGGVADKIGNVLDVISHVETAYELVEAFQRDDRDKFAEIIADSITDMTADFLADKASAWLYKQGVVTAGAGIVTGGTSLILAGVELVGGWVLSQYGSDWISSLMNQEPIRGLLLDLGGWIYDMMKGKPEDDGNGQMCKPGDSDPFDSQPESGTENSSDKKGKFQGLKKLEI